MYSRNGSSGMLLTVFAVVDIGSNSVKILVAKMQQGVLHEVFADAETTSLARNLAQTGQISEPSIQDTINALKRFQLKISEEKIENVRVIATAAMREATNAADLAQAIQQIFNRPVEIISGLAEAEFSLHGALTARPTDSSEEECAFVDLGGASTEIGFLHPTLKLVSTSLGALKTHDFLQLGAGPIPDQLWTEAKTFVQTTLRNEVPENIKSEIIKKNNFIAVGGTIVMAVKALGYAPIRAGCYQVSRFDLEAFADRLRKISDLERLKVPGIKKDRADILPFGILLLTEILSYFQQSQAISTTHGLRHGVGITTQWPV